MDGFEIEERHLTMSFINLGIKLSFNTLFLQHKHRFQRLATIYSFFKTESIL